MDDEFDRSEARLAAAGEALSGAIEARLARESVLVDTEAMIQRMTTDRGRLARELDGALARSERLEKANREVSHRLVDAMERVRDVISPPEAPE
ncbi:DUF4164 family protein [Fulvimarina sp. 2208YS6-2-32]|uniref:DUF4164 family protein n=2 Tax=Fulvimarina uroteuthidis TaxID=3098149 RepID=A0ABU5I595_9HYPH|nr:DUF4164 family protein [Fulvimarina sp. 2208YS6-2-32]MDY8110262.1 DUF4164 family protein [Fulvimarina sp. 2208YS6-2-32]